MTDHRLVVWAAPRDARLTCEFLGDADVTCVPRTGWLDVRAALQEGPSALLVAGELLTPDVVSQLAHMVERQPAWSDLPIIVIASDDCLDSANLYAELGNVSVLCRPLSLDTLRSSVSAALRARRRQYQVRDLLRQRDEADRRKDEFLAMLAHELRNPLAPLRTGLQLLQLRPPAEVVARTYAMLDRQIAHISRLVDDLLEVSRLTRGKIILQKQALALDAAAQQAIDSFRSLAAQKGVQLHVDVPRDLVIEADPVRLEQLIGNLLSNAIKFTPESGQVWLSATREGTHDVVLRVRDTGAGIPPTHLPYVFDLFAQTHRALDRSQGGLGIGLTVVKLLTELHGGSAAIHSEGEGRGTEVTIRFRLARVTAQPQAPAAGSPRSGTHRRRVLIIEDNRDAGDILGTYLRFAGHEVRLAHDGPSGLRAAFEMRPHVIVCDIGLPGMDGYQVAQSVRAAPDLADCVLVAVTGYGETAARERARRVGFTHHLTKPADPGVLADIIGQVSASQSVS